MQVESAAAEQIYARTFQEMRPRTPLPSVRVEFRRYANANAQIKLENGLLHVKMADTLAGAPATVIEALAEILLSKLFRRPVPRDSNDRYRRYLNGKEVRRSLDLVRQLRGPHLRMCAWWRSRSRSAVTAAVSPRSLPQSSTGRFEVRSVLARS
jgi:hypothetical protein